ncbi:flagellar basal-body MS-ring/collar protein FliF [Beijerinckia sp. L45]|uniref:flagellar basal-body MS-ring/collar protein FliF n=1 Tax=Beijerinckia sp. L45 TaxID=1641855 RepID=UPI00131BBD2D|nr:flagellar basal-body MS-ring/collar protein FliF [Beijerinckia sp. L45]
MSVQDQLQKLLTSLMQLGWRRLTALGLIGLAVFAITGLGGYYLSRPSMETLYAGLDRQDVSGIGAALTEAGIPFDVSSDGTTVLVKYNQTSPARMLLAEKGLPHSANAGYELYDKLGSLGLTSFMQDVTRVRAMEGELARTIQTMNGIRAARVHIVLPDEGSFRRAKQPPSASVMIRSDTIADGRSAEAIRHLVAAAVPGMTVDLVTVLNTDGTLLSTDNSSADAAPGRMITLEKTVSKDIQEDVRKTLTPYLGLHNFQVTVATKLNTDNRQTNETIYNPDSRVERSTRVIKENQTNQNNTSQAPTTVANNLPAGGTGSNPDSKVSSTDNQKKEELTNYELSSKVVTTVSGGYAIDHLSLAVLINKAALAAAASQKGGPSIEAQIADIEQVVVSASGFNKARGDSIKVLAVDFSDAGHDLDPVPSPGITDILLRQSGTAINAATVLIVAILLILFGIRPLTRLLAPPVAQEAEMPMIEPLADFAALPTSFGDDDDMSMPTFGMESEPNLIEDVTNKPKRSPQRRLEQMVEFDEMQAATILKQWVSQGSAA